MKLGVERIIGKKGEWIRIAECVQKVNYNPNIES